MIYTNEEVRALKGLEFIYEAPGSSGEVGLYRVPCVVVGADMEIGLTCKALEWAIESDKGNVWYIWSLKDEIEKKEGYDNVICYNMNDIELIQEFVKHMKEYNCVFKVLESMEYRRSLRLKFFHSGFAKCSFS